MIDSKKYWETRYKHGGNSGLGSYGEYKLFKTKIINNIIEEYNISSIYDLGCGDGSQIENLNIFNKEYIGFDISDSAINICSKKYPNLVFDNINNIEKYEKVDLTMSNDVLYHLIEDNVFNDYIYKLLKMSNKYVLVFSTNFNSKYENTHIKHRYFHDKMNGFNLLKTIENEVTNGIAKFYLYEKNKL